MSDENTMPSPRRVVAAAAVLIVVLALILAMLIINHEVGLWEWGSRLDTSRFVPGTGEFPPLDGGR